MCQNLEAKAPEIIYINKMPIQLSRRFLIATGIGGILSLLLFIFWDTLVPLTIISELPWGTPSQHVDPFSTVKSLQHILPDTYNSSLGNVAVVTFLSTRDEEDSTEEDAFFIATRTMAYKLLYDPVTGTRQGIPFLVMVTPSVALWKREQLTKDGAHVFEVDFIPISDAMKQGEKRWIDQYTKLRLWELTAFDRLLYIDSDMLILKCLDGIFDDPAAHPVNLISVEGLPDDELDAPEKYLLAGVDDVYGPNNPIPRPPSDSFNAGFFLLQPSTEMFAKYHRVMHYYDRYQKNQMEQGLLNYVHRLNGNLPWQRLTPGKWSVTWPNINDWNYGVATLHDKFWGPNRDSKLKELWEQDRDSMFEYFKPKSNVTE